MPATLKTVRFDRSIDWEAEKRRTTRGFKSRRERKELKAMADRNSQARSQAVLEILHFKSRLDRLVPLSNQNDSVRTVVNTILNEFNVASDDNICTRLTAFREISWDDVRERRTDFAKSQALSMIYIPAFYDEFRRYIPASVIISSSEGESDDGHDRNDNPQRQPAEPQHRNNNNSRRRQRIQSLENANKRVRRSSRRH